MAIVGGNVTITPTWGGAQNRIDLQWDTNDLSKPVPTGNFWGDIAYLGGTGSNTGEFEFRSAANEIVLFVPVPAGGPGYRRMVASVDGCGLPLQLNGSGTGRVFYGVTGASTSAGPLVFQWTTP